jgi:hypothetical protein
LDIPKQTENGETSSPIPRKKKSIAEPNGHGMSNGNGANGSAAPIVQNDSATKKRTATEALGGGDSPTKKRAKANGTDDGFIMVDDAADGAIVIDDD